MKKIYTVLLSILLIGVIFQANAQITGSISVCTGDIVTYTVPVSIGAGYSWNVTGGNIIGPANADSVVISWGMPGTGMLIATIIIPNSPPVYYFLNVTIHPKPGPKITHAPYPSCPSEQHEQGVGTNPDHGGKDNCENVCKYSIITYSTLLNPGSSYLWGVNGGLVLTGQFTNSATVSWDSSPYGSITVYETNQWGCMDSSTLCINKVDLPVAQFTHQMSVCKGSTVLFHNLSTGAISYQWYFGDGGTSTLTDPSHIYQNGGTYTITLIATNKCFCKDTIQSIIQVDSLPGPDISCPSTVCAFDTAMYTTSQPGCTYNWFVTGGVIIGPSNQQSVSIAWGAGQMGVLGLYVSGCATVCSDTTWIYIPIIPAVGQIAGPQKVCPGDCVTYTLPHFSGTTYNWSLASGSCGTFTDTCHCEHIEICFNPYVPFCNDTLKVNYFNPTLGCGGTAFLTLHVRPKLSIFGNTMACANGSSNFFTSPAVNCNWTVSPAGPVLSTMPSSNLSVNWNNLTGNFVLTAIPVNPNQVCNDSASIKVNVIAPPAAPVISGDTLVCPNSTFQYCATGTGNIQWVIVGGTPVNGSGNCITVNWGNTPPFQVKSFIQMAGTPFCSSDTTVQNVTPFISLPIPAINGNNSACANATSNYSTAVVYPAGVNYNWTLSPANSGTILSGQGSNGIQVEWGNNAPQTVVITLNVSICGLISSDTIQVHLHNPPTPVITQIGNLCPGVTAQLTVSGGVFVGYNWTGPSFSSTSNPVTISLKGLYQVTVTDAGGCTALTQITTNYVGAPVASISSPNILTHCAGSIYSDNLCALGNGSYTYLWSNAATSQCNPVSVPGTYNVTVTDPFTGCYSISNLLTVSEIPCLPDTGQPCIPNGSISFTHSFCNPKVFTNTSVNGGSFFWNFGDFTYSNATNPTHTYTQAAFYIVSLTGLVPNAAGTDSCMLNDTALIEIPLLAKYSFSTGCYGSPACFTDNSATTAGNSITSWYWDFGDGNNSGIQNPCHVYTSAGQFFVTLTISNGSCTTSIIDTVNIPPQVIAAFTISNTSCLNSPVAFTDNSTTNINYWNWNFGNGGTSLNQNPSQSYGLPGSYLVTLTVHDINGCYATVTDTVNITAPLVSGNITAYPDTIVCAGTPVLLVAPFCPSCSYLWNNGSTNDSITVTSTGIYAVNITDINGCIYSTFIKIIVNQGPFAVISGSKHNLCLGDFTNLYVPYNLNWTYNWISNDTLVNGNIYSGVNIFPYAAGTYTYQVIITDTTTGCSDTTAAFVINVHIPPVPPTIWAIGPTTVCQGDSIQLVVSHPDSTVSISWNTGEVNDTISVGKNGCYSATVTDTNGCTSQATFCVTVNPLPELCAFYEGCLDTCAPYTILGPPGAATYQWVLNGTPIAGATSQNYVANVSGVYSLILTNSFGCTDTTGNLNLSVYHCGDSLCAEFVIDSIFCNPENGSYVLNYHVINLSPVFVSEVNLQVLPPNLYVAYAPNLLFLNLPPGDTSLPLSTTIFNGTAGSTLCFRVHISSFDEMGNEILCCTSDTACVTLPECGADTSCCYLNIIHDSIWCVPAEFGMKQYHFNIVTEGCGELTVLSTGNGPISMENQYFMNGGLTSISGSYYSNEDSVLCLTFLVFSGCGFCVDTTICFELPDCPPVTPCDNLFADYVFNSNGLTVNFNNQSVGVGGMVIIAYSWNFGDPASGPNNVSALINPSHTFSAAGTYTVCLVVVGMIPGTSIICTKMICHTVVVEDVATDPCASLLANFAYTLSGLNASFTNLSTTGPGLYIGSWSWNFGDPASGVFNNSNLQNPNHIFSVAGSYTVCLIIFAKTIDGTYCYDTICKTFFVEGVSNPCDNLVGSYSFNTNGLTANFTNTSTAGGGLVFSSIAWNFGDPLSGANNVSNLQNPSHTFTSSGWYDVCMIVEAYLPGSNLKCADTICDHIFVEGVTNPDPCDSVSANFSHTSFGLNTNFNEISVLPVGISITAWSWNFGDPASGLNNFSSLPNPSHLFTSAGFHTVCLAITTTNPIDIICYDTICKTFFVEGVSNPCDNLVGSYSFNSNGLTANFTNTSTAGGGLVFSSIAWNFGDPLSGANNVSNLSNPSHTFTSSGWYYVCMIVEAYIPGSNLKCADTICMDVQVIAISTGGGVSGNVTYDNAVSTAMNNTTVSLMSGNNVVDTTFTNANGHYSFTDITPGTYQLIAHSTKQWGGVNATDALIILKHFVGSNILTGIRKTVADVDASGYINSGDALQAMKRFVNIQSSFAAGDWAFEHHSVDITAGGNLTDNFKGACFGDVNGSYLPPTAKPEPVVFLEKSGVQFIENGQKVILPLKTKQSMECGAVSLVLYYPEKDLEILGVEAVFENQNLIYNAAKGELRLAWYTLTPISFKEDDALFNLQIRLKESNPSVISDLNITLTSESSIADGKGNELLNKTLFLPELLSNNEGFSLNQNRPNPFSSTTLITFTIPESGDVKLILFDICGKQIKVIEDRQFTSGNHSINFSSSGIDSGVYFYSIYFTNGNNRLTQTRRMVITP